MYRTHPIKTENVFSIILSLFKEAPQLIKGNISLQTESDCLTLFGQPVVVFIFFLHIFSSLSFPLLIETCLKKRSQESHLWEFSSCKVWETEHASYNFTPLLYLCASCEINLFQCVSSYLLCKEQNKEPVCEERKEARTSCFL